MLFRSSYANPIRFHFTDLPVIWARNQICAIGSKNKEEILYLFALLNSPIISSILNFNLKSEHEKNLLISTTAIKEFVRVPKINEDNQFIKDEIIKKTEEMLVLEEKKLSDFVDFSNIMVQKYDSVSVKDCHLVLKRSDEVTKLDIRENFNLIKKVTYEKYNKKGLISDKQSISLSELKDLPLIDCDKQRELKDYIDDLVFALYFNINIKNLGLNKETEIKSKLLANKYYNLVKTHTNN